MSRPPARARLAVWALAAALAAVTVLAVAGCGSSSPTRQDVIDRGNAICASALRSLRAIPSSTAGGNPGGYFARVLPIVEAETTQLRKLPRPAAQRALLGRFIAAATRDTATYQALARAARAGDVGGENTALSVLRDSPSSSLAQRYGLVQCGAVTATAGS